MKPAGTIYRLGRAPDPWTARDWALAGPDGTFGNRFDDPTGVFRVIYASSQRLGCFVETLARFRLEASMIRELAEIEGESDHNPLGNVPAEWFDNRVMGAAVAEGEYADICSAEWIGKLRSPLLRRFLDLDDVDASVLQRTAPREVTQEVSSIIFDHGFAGIYYRSKYGHELENWAIFEPFPIIPVGSPQPIYPTDPDFRTALSLLSLSFD